MFSPVVSTQKLSFLKKAKVFVCGTVVARNLVVVLQIMAVL